MKNPLENGGKFIKDAALTTLITAASMFAGQEAFAGNGKEAKMDVEALKEKHVLHNVSAQRLQGLIKEGKYESLPGSTTDVYLQQHADGTFTVTEAVGQSHSAAKMSALEQMPGTFKVYDKMLSSNNEAHHTVSVILIAAEK